MSDYPKCAACGRTYASNERGLPSVHSVREFRVTGDFEGHVLYSATLCNHCTQEAVKRVDAFVSEGGVRKVWGGAT